MISLIEKFISFQKVDQNIPVGKISKKIQCHVVKNTLLQTAFFSILPTGINEVI